MSVSNTQFNPFGNHETNLKELKLQLEQVTSKSVKQIEDVKGLTVTLERLTEIAKNIPETAVIIFILLVRLFIN